MRIRPRLALPVVASIAVLFLLAQGSPAQTGGPTLTVRVAGGGSVTSEPRGISCEPLCSAPYPRTRTGPQVVQLTATPAAGRQLEGWGESCSGVATTCTVVMNTDRVVTARFREAPAAPPDAPAGAANLSVIASAGGSVSGPGIACPGDCVEPVALGSSASLSAAAAPGYRFEGWQGACAGTGGCGTAIGGPTLVRAEFAPLTRAAGGPVGAADSDGDGARNARDLCPDSAPGTKGGGDGCGPLDPALHGELLLTRIEDEAAEATQSLKGLPAVKRIPAALRRALSLMRSGDLEAQRGDVCPGAARFDKGVDALGAAVRRASAALSREQGKLLEGPAGVGDAGEAQLAWADLHGAKLELGQALTRARAALRLDERACDALGRRLRAGGVIKSLDDATGLLTLGSGKRFLLPAGRFGNRVAEGSRVSITAVKTNSGPDLVEAVEAGDGPLKTSAELSPCVKLRIAPYQNFLTNPSPVLHEPAGYRANGALWLEGGARLAASPKCMGRPGRYSLALEMRFGSSLPIEFASDLTDKDEPVPLPTGELNFGTLIVKERRQLSNCPPPSSQSSRARASKSFPCPVVQVSKTEYEIRIRQDRVLRRRGLRQDRLRARDPVARTCEGHRPHRGAPDDPALGDLLRAGLQAHRERKPRPVGHGRPERALRALAA